MPDFDTSVPHIARVYDYWLGGTDNFAADRAMGERTMQAEEAASPAALWAGVGRTS